MRAADEREAEEFLFDVLTAAERAEANCLLVRAFGVDEAGWPEGLGWRPKSGKWLWQRGELDRWLAHASVLAYKARQLGLTWLACALTARVTLYRVGSLCLMYRQKEEEAWENVGRVWTLLKSLPQHLWNRAAQDLPMQGKDAKSEIKLRFPNGRSSRVLAMTSAPASGHGKTAALVVLDEFAHIQEAEAIMAAVSPAVGSGGRVVIISTANGISDEETGRGNQFHYYWANSDELGFSAAFLGVFTHPDRDDAWYETSPDILRLKKWQRAAQFPRNPSEGFRFANQRHFFDEDALDFYGDLIRKPLYRLDFCSETGALAVGNVARVRKDDLGRVRVYVDPQPERKYAIGADSATGRGRDYSTAYVVDLGSMKYVAEFRGRLGADLFAAQLNYLARWYNDAFLAVENNGIGEATIVQLRHGREGRRPYPNLYRHIMPSRPSQDISKAFGFPVNTKTRPLILNQLEKATRDQSLPWVTSLLLTEMQAFVYRDTDPSPAAQDGAHDDCVFGAAIALEMYRLRGEHPNRPLAVPSKPDLSRPWHSSVTSKKPSKGGRDTVVWVT